MAIDTPPLYEFHRTEKPLHSIRHAARLAGIEYSLFWRYLHGERVPGGENLLKLADYYGVGASSILQMIEAARRARREAS